MYGLFLVLVGVSTTPGNVGLTIIVILIGMAIAAAGALVAWRAVRPRHPSP